MALRNPESKIKVGVSSCLLGEAVRRLLGAGPISLKRFCAIDPLPSPTLYRAGNLLTANYKKALQGASPLQGRRF